MILLKYRQGCPILSVESILLQRHWGMVMHIAISALWLKAPMQIEVHQITSVWQNSVSVY